MAASIYASLFRLMGIFCHQMPERSWFVYGVQLPLCIRCTAITLGVLLAATYLLARRPIPSITICLLGSAPMVLDLVLANLEVYQSTNTLRALTGVSFGFFFLIGSLSWLASRGGPTRSWQARSSSPS